MRCRFIAVGVLVLAGCVLMGSQKTPSPRLGIHTFLYTEATRYEPLAWMRGGDRFPLGSTIFRQAEGGKEPLAKNFAASSDPSVSFDGARVIFAGKRSAIDHWQVWEISLTTGEARRITSCRDDCIRPFYLPEDRVVYAHKIDGRFVIEVAPLAGGSATPLTYAPGNFLPTDVLRDGRVLFEASYPFGSATTSELYTVYTDGSGVESYRCDHGNTRHAGKQLASADIVFAREQGLARFTSALAHETEVTAPAGEYAGDVVETNSGEWLFSRRSDANRKFRLESWKPGSKSAAVLVAEKDADVVQPVLLVARHVPNRHPSGLHDWTYANLLCLNAYTSKYRFTSKSISSAQLYTPDSKGEPKLLGSTIVEKDGSFYLRVPADQPLRIQLLDSAGKSLKKEEGWFWMRRGEQRVCVGCHAGPETAPENAVPMVLRRSIIPADMTQTSALAAAGGK
jgi:hydrazine synthase alpha subunit-like protein